MQCAQRGGADFGGHGGVLHQGKQGRREVGERELFNGGQCSGDEATIFRGEQKGRSRAKRVGGRLGFARGERTPEAGDFVAAAGLRPIGEHFEGFDAEGIRGIVARGEGGEGEGVRRLAEAEVGVQRAAEHKPLRRRRREESLTRVWGLGSGVWGISSRLLTSSPTGVEESGELWKRRFDREVGDGAGGFENDARVGVVEELGDERVKHPPTRQ